MSGGVVPWEVRGVGGVEPEPEHEGEERKHKTKRGLGFNFPVEWGDLDLEQKKGKELVSQ